MATQTGSIDMAAMAEAAKTANNYVTDLGDSGIRVHPADDAGNYAAIDASGMSVVRDSESVAHFGESTRIGVEDGNHALLDSDSFDIYHDDVEMVHFGYGEGAAASGTADAPYYTLGLRSTAGAQIKGNYSVAAGHIVEASGFASHAEGDVTIANAPRSHAEGSSTIASGSCSHAEGDATYAAGFAAHAEGYMCHAGGDHSHAQNLDTIAGTNQTAIGKYNANSSANAFEIGNGTADDARSNAFAVGWDGTVTAAGEVVGATAEAALTLASGVTATTATTKRSGNVVTVYVSELRLASELSNHATATVATVPDGYRPAYAAYAHLAGWNDGGSYVTVGTNGSVTVNNQSGASIPATRALGFTLTYVM